jgi:hypothetical protein
MGRLIVIERVQEISSHLSLRVGDMPLFTASGGHVRNGPEVIQMLGAFITSTLGDGGEIYTPLGPPNHVLFRCLSPGSAEIDIVTSDLHRLSAVFVRSDDGKIEST